MALSGTAQNFAGGVMILLMKPYRIGDYISAQGQSGTVRDIKLFSTVIATADQPDDLHSQQLDRDGHHRQLFHLRDAPRGLDRGHLLRRRRGCAARPSFRCWPADPRVLPDPAPVVWVAALADSSVNLSIRAWVKNADYWNVFFEHNEQFYKELPKAGINFPFPQMDVHLTKE